MITELYQEIAQKINDELPDIRWVDLWHNQVSFLDDEHPFPTPAVFLSFRMNEKESTGKLVHNIDTEIDFYLFFETFLDTFQGSYNQSGALSFLDSLQDLHRIFHGGSGTVYSEMRRKSLIAVDTGSAGNLYRISFECLVVDTSATPEYLDLNPNTDVNVSRYSFP